MELTLVFIVFSAFVISVISGHGYMVSPPARNSMWRFGYPNPVNYNDRSLFCGGRWAQITNGGKCGICGDNAAWKNQPHMDGGLYSNNIIGRKYKQGQVINAKVKLTASHKGYFEFRIGEYDNQMIQGDQHGKLKGYLLQQENGKTRYPVTKTGDYHIRLRLPAKLTCQRCVIQWWYRTGNSWGCDQEGCGLGHGDQEHFVNCADVSIE